MPEVRVAHERCTGCGMCVNFCPVDIFELGSNDGKRVALVSRMEDCWACDTCVGQCPENAIEVIESREEAAAREAKFSVRAEPLPAEERTRYRYWQKTLREILGLRWDPVAITLVKQNDPVPNAPMPRVKLRYCQSLMMARRGKTLLMPAQCHACPDGTHILGLTEIPPKLASGEMYLHFKKLASMEAAKRMVAERPRLPERSTLATLVAPLGDTPATPDVIAVIAKPEQIMWLSMSASFESGKRSTFHVSGYNAQCVETTLLPYTAQKFNISLGCYGCRASSDIGDELMFMGIPTAQMPALIEGLKRLGQKAIGDSRRKIYLPPNV
ncbi:MAG: (4Fe-4S)-binding protein [Desulfuromonas sp.]|nr:MAG: (4Fe-4S)-binding protein [Desulfuromonas sp.]